MSPATVVPIRARDWLRQADRDLQHAKRSRDAGDFEWACFATQQAAEKAVEALYQSIHVDVIGHSVSRMLEDLPANLKPAAELVERAKELDRHYVPSRYPNFHPEGAPMDYCTEHDAAGAIEGAERILEFCRDKIPQDQLR